MRSRESNREFREEELMNRTGIKTHPELSAEMIQGAKKTMPSSKGDRGEIAERRAAYVREAPPIGSMPMISNADGEIDADAEAQPESLRLLLDKLGERLAFERQGARLYETVVKKFEVMDGKGSDSMLDGLRHILEEETEHFTMLQKAITDLGGDATVQTPSADVAGVLSQGILQIVADPRTNEVQTLQAMLNAELADNDGWQMLVNLSSAFGHSDLQEPFEKALESEREHLDNVRGWLESRTLAEVHGGDHPSGNGAQRNRKAKSPRRSTKKRIKK